MDYIRSIITNAIEGACIMLFPGADTFANLIKMCNFTKSDAGEVAFRFVRRFLIWLVVFVFFIISSIYSLVSRVIRAKNEILVEIQSVSKRQTTLEEAWGRQRKFERSSTGSSTPKYRSSSPRYWD